MKYLIQILVLSLSLFLASCSDDKSDDAEIYVGEQDAAIVGEQQAAKRSAAVRGATYKYYNTNEKTNQRAWRINKKGPAFGSRLLITFSSGFRAIVPNSSKRCVLPNKFTYRPGTGSIASGTGTSHGGVYIYGPKGDKSTTLTITRL